jgi:hypothetical protein
VDAKFTASGTPDGETDYLDLVASVQSLSGTTLEAALRARLALDQYLRWLSLMSLLHSGDYSDELMLIGTETRGAAGNPVSFFHIHGWDTDDIFQDCHLDSRYAFDDSYGLSHCAESELDHKLLSDPHTYGLYVNALDEVITELSSARFRGAVDRAVAKLLAVLATERARLAMVELLDAHPDAVELAALEAALAERAEELAGLFEARRSELAAGIAAYRASGL